MSYLIGLDLGTSGVKTVLFDCKGNKIASETCEYPLYQPYNGWAEQEPEDWWKASCESIRAVLAKSAVKANEIRGIGLSGQMHGLVMLDSDRRVLRRCILWCDQRSAPECEEMTSKVGRDRIIELTANPAMPGFTASKIMWVKNNEPHIYEKCVKILVPKDYIRYKLTGEFATEVSDASGMQLLDINRRCWSGELVSALGIDRELLPDIYESYEISGKVCRAAADMTGLAEGTPVAGGAGDQQACAVGNGIVKEGALSVSMGTSAIVFAHTDKVVIDRDVRVHTLCHAVPGAWCVLGVTQSAGSSLKWFRDNFCASEKETAALMNSDPYYLMDKQAQLVPEGSNGIIYLPYLMGDRTPHLDPDARGVFFGLSTFHTRRDMLRSVMEGVSFSLRESYDIIKEMGIEASQVRVTGGGGNSALWRQMLADIFPFSMSSVNSSEGGALGVAILAGVGTGIFNSVEEACDELIKVKGETRPNLESSAVYNRYYSIYKRLYGDLKGSFDELARLRRQ